MGVWLPRAALTAVLVSVVGLGGCASGDPQRVAVSTRSATRLHRHDVVHVRRSTSCFASPGGCGYPDPRSGNVGPFTPCSSMPTSASITTSSDGQIITGVHVIGQIVIRTANVIVNDVCVTDNGGAQLGSTAIQITGAAAAHALIENSIIAGANPSAQSVEIAVSNWGAPGAALRHDEIYNCGECVHDEPWTISDSYVMANGMQGTGDHTEPVYINDGTLVARHDTLLLPPHRSPQVAVVFTNVNDGNGGPCRNHVTVRDSLLAGGGFPLMLCAHATSVGTSTMTFVGNRLARCVTRPIAYNRQTGGIACRNYRGIPETAGTAGADAHGYWPNGGYYGVAAGVPCPPRRGQVWARNVWDDSGAPLECR